MNSKLEKALAELERAQAQLAEVTKQLKRFPEEPPVGSVLRFYKRVGHGRVRTYVAFRASHREWFITGRGVSGMPKSWDTIVEFIGDSTVERFTSFERIGEGE